jgi:hypothetical protein
VVKYIIYIEKTEAEDLIERINQCLGFPNDSGTITYSSVDNMCEYDSENDETVNLGWGVQILDYALECLTEEEKGNVFILPDNINTCAAFKSANL